MTNDVFEALNQLQSMSYSDEPESHPIQSRWYDDHHGIVQQDRYNPSENNFRFDHQPTDMQLDAFDEAVLELPEPPSRQATAAFGQAGLCLPHGHNRSIPCMDQDSRVPIVTHYDAGNTYGVGDSLELRNTYSDAPFFSSPALLASQRQARNATWEPNHNSLPTPSTTVGSAKIDYALPQSNARQWRNNSTVAAARSQARSNDLLAVHTLPSRFSAIFPFQHFNAIQSQCFELIYLSSDNVVLSAPTGSGKTVIFELAICRLLAHLQNDCFKIVYMAPTKALCSERQRDWRQKFASLKLRVEEMTGDSDAISLHAVQNADVIVTTPEKWDSMTRKWKDHARLVQLIRLFLIDEVHILNKDRGAALEAVVSRMKSMGSQIRYLALSATIPNPQDIAAWLGRNTSDPGLAALREQFDESFRPVPLQRHICGFESQSSTNDFAFDALLNQKLVNVIARYSVGKPIMVFCFTKNSCKKAAEALASWWSSLQLHPKPWNAPSRIPNVHDKDLKALVPMGVAIHHGGIAADDRAAIEKAYLEGQLNVICCTSTLAVGINLPCQMVVIKGTVAFDDNNRQPQEMSDVEMLQMIGRAGRPQFDDSATAVIMTRINLVDRYKKLIAGQETLESRLHTNLIEHINAEIGLGTVSDLDAARRWLSSTFMYVRLKANPEHYRLEGARPGQDIEKQLDSICASAISQLQDNQLVERESMTLRLTKFGHAMARYYVNFETMKLIVSLPYKAKISEILSTLCQAHEFREMRFKSGEKKIYKDANKSPSIRYPIKVDLNLPAHKVSMIVQVTLGGASTDLQGQPHRLQFGIDQTIIFQHARRLIRCIVDCFSSTDDSVTTRNALMLVRSLSARIWDDSSLHVEQLNGIGPAAARKLINADVKSIDELARMESHRIESILSKNPPYGMGLLKQAKEFPHLALNLKTTGKPVITPGQHAILHVTAEIGFLNSSVPTTFQKRQVFVCILAETSDGRLLHFGRISAQKLGTGQKVIFEARITSQGQVIMCYLACEDLAGTLQQATIQPDIPAKMLPSVVIQADIPQGARKANTTTNRNEPGASEIQGSQGLDEYDDAALDDHDLTQLDCQDTAFRLLEEVERSSAKVPLRSQTKKKNVAANHDAGVNQMHWQPEKLKNGRWKCQHRCKDRDNCKHDCCRNGVENKPKPPKVEKARTDKTTVEKSQTKLKMPSKSGQTLQSDLEPGVTESVDLTMKGQSDLPFRNVKRTLQVPQAKPEYVRRWPAPAQTQPVPTLFGLEPRHCYPSEKQPTRKYLESPDDDPDIDLFDHVIPDSTQLLSPFLEHTQVEADPIPNDEYSGLLRAKYSYNDQSQQPSVHSRQEQGMLEQSSWLRDASVDDIQGQDTFGNTEVTPATTNAGTQRPHRRQALSLICNEQSILDQAAQQFPLKRKSTDAELESENANTQQSSLYQAKRPKTSTIADEADKTYTRDEHGADDFTELSARANNDNLLEVGSGANTGISEQNGNDQLRDWVFATFGGCVEFSEA